MKFKRKSVPNTLTSYDSRDLLFEKTREDACEYMGFRCRIGFHNKLKWLGVFRWLTLCHNCGKFETGRTLGDASTVVGYLASNGFEQLTTTYFRAHDFDQYTGESAWTYTRNEDPSSLRNIQEKTARRVEAYKAEQRFKPSIHVHVSDSRSHDDDYDSTPVG